MKIEQNELVRSICGADRMDSAIPLFDSSETIHLKDVYNYMTCNHIYKSISGSENIFVCHETNTILDKL